MFAKAISISISNTAFQLLVLQWWTTIIPGITRTLQQLWFYVCVCICTADDIALFAHKEHNLRFPDFPVTFSIFYQDFFLRVVVKHCTLFIYTAVFYWNITYFEVFHKQHLVDTYVVYVQHQCTWCPGIIRRIIWYLMFIRYVCDKRMNTSTRSWYYKPCLLQLSKQVIARAYWYVHF